MAAESSSVISSSNLSRLSVVTPSEKTYQNNLTKSTQVTTPDVTRLVSREEIDEHVQLGECWLIIHGNVYNVTEYKHPGGSSILKKYNGKDCTAQFDEIGHSLESLIYDIDSSALIGVSQERQEAHFKDEMLSKLVLERRDREGKGPKDPASRNSSISSSSSTITSKRRPSNSTIPLANGHKLRTRRRSSSANVAYYNRLKCKYLISMFSSLLFFGSLFIYVKYKNYNKQSFTTDTNPHFTHTY